MAGRTLTIFMELSQITAVTRFRITYCDNAFKTTGCTVDPWPSAPTWKANRKIQM